LTVYEETRQAWRHIWETTDFDRELATLSYRRAQQTINTYLPYLDHTAPTLEAGCGVGQVVYYLRERGYNVIGLDYAPEGLLPTHQRYPDLPFTVGDVHHIPFPDGSFGGYLSFGVVEHFEVGPKPALTEAWRVLRPGGALVLTVPHPNFVEFLRDTVNRLVPSRLEKLGKRADYYERTYTHPELAALVAEVGFKVRRVVPISHSYTFYGLHSLFRAPGYYQTSALGERAGDFGKLVLPWWSAFETLIIANKA
jgi:SAM-dependent methyltransferase